MLPPHIITALLKWALVTNEKMASPLDHDPKLPQYYHIIHGNFRAHENTMYLATRHAIYSAALSTEATATFMFLPTCNKRMTRSPCAPLYDRFPHLCKFLGSIPSDQLQIAKVPFWNNIQTPLPKHTWEVHIIAIWNTEGRNCLNACNKNWLKDLAIEIFEVK